MFVNICKFVNLCEKNESFLRRLNLPRSKLFNEVSRLKPMFGNIPSKEEVFQI